MFRITTHRLAVVVNDAMRDLMEKFGESRLAIEDAVESKGTSYYASDLEDAVDQVNEVLANWKDLQTSLETEGRTDELATLRKENEMKLKQLEAEIEALQHDDD